MLGGSRSTVRLRLSPIAASRKAIAACAIGVATTATVFAADIPPAATAAPISIPASWAGFYLGAHGGYAWGDNDFSVAVLQIPPFTTFPGFKSKGGLYGAQAGYNWQFGRAVTGFEIDWSAAGISGNSATVATPFFPVGTFVFNRSDSIKYLGTVRGRAGWLPVDTVLLYGTAGAAWARVDQASNASVADPINITASLKTPVDQFGWVAGAGIEAMLFGPNWIGRLEYLHYDFGAATPTTSSATNVPNGSHFDRSGRQTIDTLRAALSYKFGAPDSARRVLDARASADMAAAGWAGFYLGAHGGYGWGHDNFSTNLSDIPPARIGGTKLQGGVYGGHAGHNWQFGSTVAGLEIDLSAANVSGSAQASYVLPALPTIITTTIHEKVEALGSVRARLGWLPTDNVLLYGTAGLGWERLGRTTSNSTARPAGITNNVADRSADRFGWVAGAGVEVMLPGGNWIGRLEYLHYGFGTVQTSGVTTDLIDTSISTAGNHGVDVLRAGLSYKFGEPAAAMPVRYANARASALTASWAGFYLGGHGGYGWQKNDFTQVVDFNAGGQLGGINSRGWLAGGHGGYNWQYGRFVTGLEIDFSLSDLKGSSAPYTRIVGGGGPEITTLSDKVKYLATARARLGWSPADNALLYATGGLAWERLERIETEDFFATVRTQTTPSDRVGAVIGAGVEWMPLGPNWIGRVEYLHYDFGRVQEATTVASTVPGTLSYSEHRGRQTIDVVRAGVSYKFP